MNHSRHTHTHKRTPRLDLGLELSTNQLPIHCRSANYNQQGGVQVVASRIPPILRKGLKYESICLEQKKIATQIAAFAPLLQLDSFAVIIADKVENSTAHIGNG